MRARRRGGPTGCAHRAAHPSPGYDRRDVVQSGHRWSRQRAPGAQDEDAPRRPDGLMADKAGIQFRSEPLRRPAVRVRAQIDRKLYRQATGAALAEQPNLILIADAAEDLLIEHDRVAGVIGASGRSYRAGAVVLTQLGTFLKGVIHLGEQRIPAGRVGARLLAIGLSDRLWWPARPEDGPAQDRHPAMRPDGKTFHRLGPGWRCSPLRRAAHAPSPPDWTGPRRPRSPLRHHLHQNAETHLPTC